MESVVVGGDVSRRNFLLGSTAAAGALVVGFAIPSAAAAGATLAPNAFITIDGSGAISLVVPYAEMGQGALTAIAMLVAEELEVEVGEIAVELAAGDDKIYGHPLFGDQITGGSASIRGGWKQMRTAGATTRTMLVQAAAKQWKVKPSACRAEKGEVIHEATGRRASYASLVDVARTLHVPSDVALKTSNFRVIGKPARRLDTPAKVNGTAQFGIDVRLPGMLYAAVLNCPVIGGKLSAVDEAPALAVKGVRRVVRLADAVAVIADHTAAARKGLATLNPTWIGGEALATADIVAAFDQALETNGAVAERKGDVKAALSSAASTVEMVYRLPMLAHAAMEPLNCTVSVTATGCEVWVGSQVPGHARKAAAEAAGLPVEKVKVNSFLIGGGFGRRLETDWVSQAVLIGRQVGAPVKVLWGRDQDIRHDAFRYHNHSRVRVGLDASGMPVSWEHRLVGPGVMFRFLPAFTKDGVDLDIIDDAASPYAIPNVLVDYVRKEPPPGLLVGNWRGVGATRNAVIVEGVIEELARRAKRDAVAYRRALLDPKSRLALAMERVVTESGWSKPKAPGVGRGLGIVSAFGSHVAMVAEVRMEAGKARILSITCAVDTGRVVHPDLVRQQIEGGIIFGLSAVLYGQVTVDQGRIVQSNFHDYRVARINEIPAIKVIIMDNAEEPGGVGEPGTALVAPAILNAIADAGGPRVTTLPLDAAMVYSA